jgi:hypothetical protein
MSRMSEPKRDVTSKKGFTTFSSHKTYHQGKENLKPFINHQLFLQTIPKTKVTNFLSVVGNNNIHKMVTQKLSNISHTSENVLPRKKIQNSIHGKHAKVQRQDLLWAPEEEDHWNRVSEAITAEFDDLFRMSFHVPGVDQPVIVRVPYWMGEAGRTEMGKVRSKRRTSELNRASPTLRRIIQSSPRASLGRGSPEQIQQTVQNALNQNLIPGSSGPPTGEQIHNWMKRFGLGIDCSAFVYYALERVHEVMADPEEARRFARQWGGFVPTVTTLHARQLPISRPSDLRPGDMQILPGHIRLVERISIIEVVSSIENRPRRWIEFTTVESRAGTDDEGMKRRLWRVGIDDTDFSGLAECLGDRCAPTTESLNFYRRRDLPNRQIGDGEVDQNSRDTNNLTEMVNQEIDHEIIDTDLNHPDFVNNNNSNINTQFQNQFFDEGANPINTPRQIVAPPPSSTNNNHPFTRQREGYRYGGERSRSYVIERVNRAIEHFEQDGYSQLALACKVFLRLAPMEGWLSAINTWDSQVFTWGAGFAHRGQLNTMWRSLDNSVKAYLASHPYAKHHFPGNLNITDAIRSDIETLNAIVYVSEHDPYREHVLRAQLKTFFMRTMGIPQYVIPSEQYPIADVSILSLAAHLRHWLPAFFQMPNDLRRAVALAGSVSDQPQKLAAIAAAIISIHSQRMLNQSGWAYDGPEGRQLLDERKARNFKVILRYRRNLRKLLDTNRMPLTLSSFVTDLIPSFQLGDEPFFTNDTDLMNVPPNHYVMVDEHGRYYNFGSRG